MKITNLILSLLVSLACFGQETNETQVGPITSSDSSQVMFSHQHSVGLLLGMGIGAQYGYKINETFSAGLRANYLSVESLDNEYETGGEILLMDVELKWLNMDLFVDYHPFKSKSFKLVGGVSFAGLNDFAITVSYRDSLQFGDFNFDEDDIGYVKILPTWNRLRPYVGMGFGRMVSDKKKMALNFEGGAYYAGSPTVEVEATNMLSGTSSQAGTLERNMEQLTFLPYMSFSLVYRF